MIRLALAGLLCASLLAGCVGQRPRAGVDTVMTPQGVRMVPHAGVGVGGVRLGVNPNGGRIGTRVGPLNVGWGF